MSDLPPFKIEAVVRFNDGEAYVLNRKPRFLYERVGDTLVARDGPFIQTYAYERPVGRFKAFAGAEFDIPMLDGSVTHASGQWWHTHTAGMASVTYNTKEELLKCYVFNGAACEPGALAELRAAHTSKDVYPYYAYHDAINAPALRLAHLKGAAKFKRDKSALVTQVKHLAAVVKAANTNTEGLRARITALEAWIEREAERRGAADAAYPADDRCSAILDAKKPLFAVNVFGAQGKTCATKGCQEQALDLITIEGVAADYCITCADALVDLHKADAT